MGRLPESRRALQLAAATRLIHAVQALLVEGVKVILTDTAPIASDDLHRWLGRHADLTEESINRLAGQLAAQGLIGWLAVTEGVYYEPTHPMTAVMVCSLSGDGDWKAAWAAFLARRTEAIRDWGESSAVDSRVGL